ncbi:G4 quadruplex nucleic acid binding protein [Tulasnella sp. JGI-2019a]|nr:G4 quadruplex nucleic acid binding protein [Tulasnella sp. JGI-2019a]KAG9010189.1 G4 quadruplex nucleic acid binding protein [Tulasnella sp. JGI-2019a]KAG9035623.1 G4 quadruplex nucleic acid binding protein [Tulasnella sp. JGI-2019a]
MLRVFNSTIIKSRLPQTCCPSILKPSSRFMSTEVISKLPENVRQLVQSAFGLGQAAASGSQADVTAVTEWLEKISSGALVKEDGLKPLDDTLTARTYLHGTEPTAADVALYATLHPVMEKISKLPGSNLYATPSITRYFDHIQNLSVVRSASDAPALIPLGAIIESAPKLERKAPEPAKKKTKKEGGDPATTEAAAVAAPKDAPSQPATVNPGKEKKEKKEKPKKEAVTAEGSGKKAGAAPAAAADSGDPSPAMIDLRVGHIVDVKRHPDADGLYVEQIDIGEETGPRTVISGLVNYIPIEQMQGKYLIVVANLKPATMRGIKSYGMVLCATSKGGKEGGIEIVDPPQGSKPGDRVFFEGDKYADVEPVPQLNPKKKVFETIQPGFTTLGTREAAWIDPATKTVHRIMTKFGPCTAPTFVEASLS